MKRFISIILLLGCSLQLSGCETLKGLGKDLNELGENIEENIIKRDEE